MSEPGLVSLTNSSQRRCPRRMPQDWQPPVPAFVADLAGVESATICCIGVQSTTVTDADPPLAFLKSRFGSAAARTERARYLDAQGYQNDVLVCYFNDRASHDAASRDIAQWWDDPARLTDATGYWREKFVMPPSHRETLFSGNDRPAGLGTLGVDRMLGPIAEHGYWGGARDRIPASAYDELEATGSAVPNRQQTAGRRVRLEPHANLCIIRSAQDATDCTGRELDLYTQRVHPTLLKGMQFLRDHPQETGCYSCRFMAELDGEGRATRKTFGLAAFVSLGHLERWAESHPTHLAIFNEFLAMAGALGAEMRLRLWHEILVLPAGGGHCFEYLNCHPATGLLPFMSAMTSR